jgi:3-hydroxyisobutyrate dehydrogenase
MSAVAVVGLGAMGGRVARRLLAAGHDLTVWNRTRERAAELVEAGAVAAESPADAARRADAVITMVADPGALRAVTDGPHGVATGARAGTTVIEMSTVGPAAVSQLAELLGGRAELLDAPVLGSLTEAESGSLKIFVGGPAAVAQRWTPLLEVLGSPIHVGPLGAGAGAKLVANSTLLGSLALLGEALALADRLGLERRAAYDVLAGTPIAGQAERRRDAIERSDYPPRFSLALARKDADLIADAAAATGAELRVTAAARSWLADAEAAGWRDRDYAAVLAYILAAGRPG